MEENYLDLSPYVRANISALKLNTYPEEKENSTIESNFLLSTYIGVKIVHRTLNSSTQEYNSFVELRNQNEKQLEAIQMGFSISKSINKYLYLKTGLEHTQINEKSIINYTTNNFSVDDDFPILLQIQSNGDTIINNGSAIINTPSLHTQTEYNNHKFITIPINLGTKGEFNKLEWFLEAGLLANLYMGFYGEMNGFEENNDSSPTYFKPKIGFGYRSNFGMNYPVSNQLKIGASINYTNYLTSISDSNLMVQLYKLGGIRLGVTYEIK